MRRIFSLSAVLLLAASSWAQTSIVRGVVKDSKTGNEIVSAVVRLTQTNQGAYTDENGLYNITGVKKGTYTISVSYLGYDTLTRTLVVNSDVETENFFLEPASKELGAVYVSHNKIRKRKEIYISQVSIEPKQLTRIPTVGGEPDLVQYLQVLPGVVFSGDQGGQLYIRGGSPVMNRVVMDGLTIYNPFHSIGLFSVFDSDILKSVEVYSAGFSAEHGGRVSAIVDINTREGNKQRFTGKVNASPFNAKLLLEGPMKPYVQGENYSSYIISYKNSYLDRAAPVIYPYVNGGELPYSFSDLYAKMSFNSNEGSRANLFGFNYRDAVNFVNSTSYEWNSNGAGLNFLLIPSNSKTIIDGAITYSDYAIEQKEEDNKPRRSEIGGYNVKLDFTYFSREADKLKYGIEMNGFTTDFEIYNAYGRRINQKENTTEINAYINYLRNFNKRFLMEAGLRMQGYASLQETMLEPRIRLKYIAGPRLRFKSSVGRYSQNLMSAVSDRDVVNLFYGFLSSPKDMPAEFDGDPRTSRLQKANHAVFGFEFDVNSNIEVNIEGYVKDFRQITNINRDKIFDNVPENNDKPEYQRVSYIVERGMASGYDVTIKYEQGGWYLWTVYSYNVVNRYDGIREYQPHFDRRHNVNFVSSYEFGDEKEWTANLRWNFGSGFPFTLTQGFYERLDFNDGGATDYTANNGDLGILYADLNTGRLPYYHRLDASLKRTIKLNKKEDDDRVVELILSATNVYNRANIFYFNRVEYKRENQLPILPSLSASYRF